MKGSMLVGTSAMEAKIKGSISQICGLCKFIQNPHAKTSYALSLEEGKESTTLQFTQ